MQASMNSRIEMCLDGGPTSASLTYETAVFMCILFYDVVKSERARENLRTIVQK